MTGLLMVVEVEVEMEVMEGVADKGVLYTGWGL